MELLTHYVPTTKELEHIHFLRREIEWADRKLRELRTGLADYEREIGAKFQSNLRKPRGDANDADTIDV